MSRRRRGRVTVQHQPTKQTRAVQKIAMIPFLAVSSFFVFIGITELIPSAGLFGVVWTLMAGTFVVIAIVTMFSKNGLAHRVAYDVETDVEQETIYGIMEEPPVEFDRHVVENVDKNSVHDHIPSMELNAKGRLEQLETLKEAGLITNEEYREKRADILSDL